MLVPERDGGGAGGRAARPARRPVAVGGDGPRRPARTSRRTTTIATEAARLEERYLALLAMIETAPHLRLLRTPAADHARIRRSDWRSCRRGCCADALSPRARGRALLPAPVGGGGARHAARRRCRSSRQAAGPRGARVRRAPGRRGATGRAARSFQLHRHHRAGRWRCRAAPSSSGCWRAVALRSWFEHGYRWRDTDRPPRPRRRPRPPAPAARRLAHRVDLAASCPWSSSCERLAAARAAFVVGTPTVLRRLALAAEATGARLSPRGSSSPGRGARRRAPRGLIERVLGTPPVEVYGLTEVGYVAWQCERREGLHVNADTCSSRCSRRPAGRAGRARVAWW